MPVTAEPLEGVNVHVPLDGKPLKATLPVAVPQVGCVIVPTVGTEGALGSLKLTGPASVFETQPAPVVTEKLL